jgi:YVTN family beta-propeller protein
LVASSQFSRRALLLSSAAAFGCGRPKATAYPGYCFIANQESRSVAVIDLTTFRRWPSISLDSEPSLVLAHPGVSKAFVLSGQSGTLSEIDAATLAVSRRTRAGNMAVTMKPAPAGDALWVLYREPAALIEIPFDSLRPRRKIHLPRVADDFDVSTDGHAAIVSAESGALWVASLDRAALERHIPASGKPTSVCFQLDGKQILTASRAGRSVSIFDAATSRLLVDLPLPMEPRHFCFSPDGGQLFVSGDGMDAVAIIYPYYTELGETILAGRAPAGMAVSGSYLLVANPETNSITVLDIDTRKLVALVQVGQEPRQILITPDQQYALVLNQKSGDVAVIRMFSLTTRRPNFKLAPLFTLIPVGAKPVSAAVVPLT